MNSENISLIPIIVIGITVLFSFLGFNDQKLFQRYMFNTGAILQGKQWDRMLTSALLHGDHMHLIFNMLTLYFFSDVIIAWLGKGEYLLIYIASILVGSILSLWMHRKNPYYNAIGASGGVSGIIFAAIALDPHMMLGVFFIVPMPGWIFGILYLAYSVYGMKAQLGNIGHDAHLGGAVAGIALAICLEPETLTYNAVYIALMAIPITALGYYIYKNK